MQSGLYAGKSYIHVFGDIVRNHPKQLLSGVVPGLLRSSLANGTSMIIYKKIEKLLNDTMKERRRL